MSEITISHNLRFSKPLRTLESMRENGIQSNIISYLNQKFSRGELLDIDKQLYIVPRDILQSDKNFLIEHNLLITTISKVEVINIITRFPKRLKRLRVTGDILLFSGECPRPC